VRAAALSSPVSVFLTKTNGYKQRRRRRQQTLEKRESKKERRKIQDEKEKKEQETTLASAQLFIAVKLWRRERSANTRRQGRLIPKVSHEASTTIQFGWKNPFHHRTPLPPSTKKKNSKKKKEKLKST
jgi:hypothetical protein